eukprot:TRINITY_DN23554_c0_g1_i1.p1 TRINITY_DN23554_c0_g1~~TRINITY_DN23554_c0_g1_i1.p1  ORF type:complete len:494 (-),score=113.02 TRINITY_DN23554_c0_g1_i1:309-1736(-)
MGAAAARLALIGGCLLAEASVADGVSAVAPPGSLGMANVTFRRECPRKPSGGGKRARKSCREYHHAIFPVWPLPLESPADVRSQLQAASTSSSSSSSSPPSTPSLVSLRLDSLAVVAKVAREQLRLALAASDLPRDELRDLLDDNLKAFFDPETDELRAGLSLASPKGQLLWTLWLILKPLSDAAATAVAEAGLLPCEASHVHCAVWDWYLRGLLDSTSPDADYFSSVHLDGKLMLGKKTKKSSNAWNYGSETSQNVAENDEWWNVWVLLSEAVGDSRLLLLDPRSWNLPAFLAKKAAYVWPPDDFTNVTDAGESGRRSAGDEPSSAEPEELPAAGAPRFLGLGSDARQGDLLAFRSARVAHGAGSLLATTSSASAPSKRVSFDARCRCAPMPLASVVATSRGELCAATWMWRGQRYHGCLRAGQKRPWCVLRTRAPDAGAGCILDDGGLCPHPCGRMQRCAGRLYDFCDEAATA